MSGGSAEVLNRTQLFCADLDKGSDTEIIFFNIVRF